MRDDGFFPTMPGIAAYALALYFFLYFSIRAWKGWREERLQPARDRVPQRKYVSLGLAFICSLGAVTMAVVNGTVPRGLYDLVRAWVLVIMLGLFLAIRRVEAFDQHRANRKVDRRDLERRKATPKEWSPP